MDDQEIRLNELREVLTGFSYPMTKADVAAETESITLHYADGSEPLPAVIERSSSTTYASVDDLEAEIFTNLPTEAVGEPGQSEGEG